MNWRSYVHTAISRWLVMGTTGEPRRAFKVFAEESYASGQSRRCMALSASGLLMMKRMMRILGKVESSGCKGNRGRPRWHQALALWLMSALVNCGICIYL